ncbi:MAG: lysophospholipid acyltransferase family protein [Planctomycetota bacterium]
MSGGVGTRQRFNDFWLGVFFAWVRWAPGTARWARPAAVALAWRAAGGMRRAVRANLRRVLGAEATAAEIDRTGRAVVGSFYDFVCEVGANHDRPLSDLVRRIASVEGKEAYLAARAERRGAVLVTAHFGNFEVGLAAMREVEERVHVVFRRDRQTHFERLRSELHRSLGVIETPIDDGVASWLALRDALASDAVVMLQGDRSEPGQKSVAVPFAGGTLRLPVGPAKLAMMAGAPLVPVFALRVAEDAENEGGKVRIVLGEPIEVADAGAVESAVNRVAAAIEERVRRRPEQWHVLEKAFVEDRESDRVS